MPHAAETLTDQDIDTFYTQSLLGSSNPDALLRTLHRNNMTFFGMRATTEHRNLRWGDIALNRDSGSGLRFLEYRTERVTKTRQGDNPRNRRQVNPKAFEIPECDERCPVKAYLEYSEKRPSQYSRDDDPFYVASNTNWQRSGVWFKQQPVGVNKISNFVPLMAKISGVGSGRRLSNTSYRKQLAMKLNEYNIPKEVGRHVTGHKNASSLDSYSALTNAQQQHLSTIVSGQAANSDVASLVPPLRNNSAPSVRSISDPAPDAPHALQALPSLPSTHAPQSSSVAPGSIQPRFAHMPGNTQSIPSALFTGAVIQGGSFKITINNQANQPTRKRIIYSSSSDEE